MIGKNNSLKKIFLFKNNIQKSKLFLLVILLIVICLVLNSSYKMKLNSKNNEGFVSNNIVIVGNAPFDKTKLLGNKIDSFNKVIRFNNFMTNDYEKYIGAKTDIWCMSCYVYYSNKKLFNERKNNINKILVLKPEVFLKQHPYQNNPKTELLIQNKDLFVPKKYDFKNKWPSTGILSIFYFLKSYPKVYITGFNNFDPKQGSIHYYENRKPLGHTGDIEKRIINDLILEGRVIKL